jgi:hypothetical protein
VNAYVAEVMVQMRRHEATGVPIERRSRCGKYIVHQTRRIGSVHRGGWDGVPLHGPLFIAAGIAPAAQHRRRDDAHRDPIRHAHDVVRSRICLALQRIVHCADP